MSSNNLLFTASDLVRTLNTLPEPEQAVSRERIRRHQMRAGYRIGNDSIHLFAYLAWLIQEDRKPKQTADYETVKAKQREKNAALVRLGQDIGEIPPVLNPERRERTMDDFAAFCKEYFPDIFYLPWSKDHHEAIEQIVASMDNGGLFALAMPRGSGKTVLLEIAVCWSILTGRSRFVVLLAVNSAQADRLLMQIKTIFETNELLYQDYPEAIYPIRKLERITSRQRGQRYRGESTYIQWGSHKIVMATIPDSISSGSVIAAAGMDTGGVRGQQHYRVDGQIVRPDTVLIDDPQTRESAKSKQQNIDKLALINGDVLKMAGPGKKLSGFIACTVIYPGDFADQILDRSKSPSWRGKRTAMVKSFPKNKDLWAEYEQIQRDDFLSGGDGSKATEFYIANRESMDDGAEVSWPENYALGEVSGIQHAMNLLISDAPSFWAECQNEPLETKVGNETLTVEEIASKVNHLPRGTVPANAAFLTGFIDVMQNQLYWLIAAWEQNFTGYVVDYGVWPQQPNPNMPTNRLPISLADVYRKNGGQEQSIEAVIYAGLSGVTEFLIGKRWKLDGGGERDIDLMLIDANWSQTTDVVYQFCRQSPYRAQIKPSHGRGITAMKTPFSEYKRQPGDRVGHHWRIPSTIRRQPIRKVLIDVNYWKSFVHERLSDGIGSPGSLTLNGTNPKNHIRLAEHFTSEYRTEDLNPSTGLRVDVWQPYPDNPDNHWFDCIVGSAVAASISGAALPLFNQNSVKAKPKRSLNDFLKGKKQ